MEHRTKKSSIEGKVVLAVALATQAKKLLDGVCDTLAPDGDDGLYDLANDIQSGDRTDIREIMQELQMDGYLDNVEADDAVPVVPEINIQSDCGIFVEIKVPVDGGKLVAANCSSDFGTQQVYLMYELGGTQTDLALAEVKRGELATIGGLAEDNMDLDLYVWGNPRDEDYTNKFLIRHEEIKEAVS